MIVILLIDNWDEDTLHKTLKFFNVLESPHYQNFLHKGVFYHAYADWAGRTTYYACFPR